MTHSDSTPLDACLLHLEGPDAADFAQAQFTSNVYALQTGCWQWSAWLDARGRVQSLFHLARLDEHRFAALLRGGDGHVLADRLRRYVFRSRLEISAEPPAPVGGGDPLPAFTLEESDGTMVLGLGDRRLVRPAAGTDDLNWRLQAIRHGEPWLPGSCLDQLLPPALGLRRLGALSLDKGCYPGQEIAARLHYRGGHKHVLVHVQLNEEITPGTLSSVDDVSMQILDCVPAERGYEALAVVHENILPKLARNDDASPRLMQRFSS